MAVENLYINRRGSDANFATGNDAEFGDTSGGDAIIRWSAGDADNEAFVIAMGDSSQATHFTDKGAVATDWNVAADTHPTLYVHSNTTPATDYMKIGAHNGTLVWAADMVGGATILMGFDGLEALELTETATAVNHIGVVNAATGNNPIIRAEGEADTGLTFDNRDGEEILILDSVATSINEVTIRSAASGNKPIFAATGTDADNGFEFHNDQAEEILILQSAATSINELTITSSAAGAGVIISTTGGDTDIDLVLTTKGTGDLSLTTGHLTNADGGIVTQITTTTTSVQVDTESGQITTLTSSLAAGGEETFTVTNDKVGALDTVILNIGSTSSAGTGAVSVTAVAAGSFDITITNLHSANAFDNTHVINFAIVGGAAS